MKKTLFITLMASVVFGITACDKLNCEICTKDSAPEVRLCESDYNSSTDYGIALDSYELQGYNCR